MNIRILVADDFAPWHRFVSSIILPKAPEWQIVCKVSDGVEAVKKAEELTPDLILLDLSLPKLGGIEAARQIRKVAPGVKILFLSAFDWIDVVEEALEVGANGYVVKLDAATELVEAVEAVLEGQRYLSRRLKGRLWDEKDTQASDKRVRHKVLLSPLARLQEAKFTRCHEIQFFSNDQVFLESCTQFIAPALRSGNGAIVLATKPHREMLLQGLSALGVDAHALLQQGAYVALDAADALSKFMIYDWPEADRFHEAFNDLIESAAKAAKAKHPRVAIFGEAAGLLWGAGKREAAIRLEQLGNDLATNRTVDILCGYPLRPRNEEDENALRAICAEHSAVHRQ